MKNGEPQRSDRRLFMQFLAFGGCENTRPLVEAALRILAEGASDEDVRKRYGEPASTLRRYRSVLRAARSSG